MSSILKYCKDVLLYMNMLNGECSSKKDIRNAIWKSNTRGFRSCDEVLDFLVDLGAIKIRYVSQKKISYELLISIDEELFIKWTKK